MKQKLIPLFSLSCLTVLTVHAQTATVDSALAGPIIDPYFDYLPKVDVIGVRPEFLPNTITTISEQQLQERHISSVLPAVAEQTPGLFVTQRSSMGYGLSTGSAGGMNMRGLGSGTGQIMVLVDGHPQFMGLMGHPLADTYQGLNIESIQVLRGPASVLYGSNAMGGVINLVTNKYNEDGAHTHANIGYGNDNTLQSQLSVSNKQGKLSSSVSGAYNRTDGHRKNMGFKQYAGYGQLGYQLCNNWQVGADLNINKFNAETPGAIDALLEDSEQDITRGTTSAWIRNSYGNTKGSISAFYNWGKHVINDGYAIGKGTPKDYRYHSRDYMGGVSANQSIRKFQGKTTATLGFDYFHFGGTAWNEYVAGEEIGTTSALASKKEDEIAGYVNIEQYLFKYLDINGGIRYNHHWLVGDEWVPQVGLTSRIGGRRIQQTTIKATASKGFRNPTIKELYMFKPANSALEAERLWSYEFALAQDLINNKLHYGINVYYIDGDNMITTQMTDGKPLNVNTGEIENKGIELEASYNICSSWSINANYSYLDMENPVVAAPEQKLYVGGRFNKKKWLASAGLQYIGGLYTQVGEKPQQEDFVLANAQLQFSPLDWLGIWVKGENLLDQDYEINAGYPMPGANFMAGANIRF